MVGPVTLTTLIGAISYVWLTVATHPLWKGLRTTLQTRAGDGWAAGFPLTAAMAALSAAIPVTASALIAMAYPRVAAELPTWVGLPVGFLAGLVTWIGRAAIFGMPRVSPDVEVALALAVVALRNDDPGILSRVERQYERYILDAPPLAPYAVEQLRTV